jgi:hypothetical protein
MGTGIEEYSKNVKRIFFKTIITREGVPVNEEETVISKHSQMSQLLRCMWAACNGGLDRVW